MNLSFDFIGCLPGVVGLRRATVHGGPATAVRLLLAREDDLDAAVARSGRRPSRWWRAGAARRSPRPRGGRRATWSRMKKRTTAVARAVDSSQFDGNCALAIGRSSVWPSTTIGWSKSLLQQRARCGRAAASPAA